MSHKDFLSDLEPHYNDALQYCRALCARWSPSEAEEVLQNALLKALTHYASLQDRSRFRSWLFQIITRTFYSSVRGAFWKRFTPFPEAGNVEPFPEIFAREEPHDDRWILHQALATLSSKQRAALLLFEIGGFSIDEITDIQQAKSISAIKSRLSRARKKLREALSEKETGRQVSLGSSNGDSQNKSIEHETITLVAQARKALK
ncbi:MAG: RNA polymerase sigma factor [Rhodothermales bacterium]